MAEDAKWKDLEDILSQWKRVKLTTWQDEMDRTALEISEHKVPPHPTPRGQPPRYHTPPLAYGCHPVHRSQHCQRS